MDGRLAALPFVVGVALVLRHAAAWARRAPRRKASAVELAAE